MENDDGSAMGELLVPDVVRALVDEIQVLRARQQQMAVAMGTIADHIERNFLLSGSQRLFHCVSKLRDILALHAVDKRRWRDLSIAASVLVAAVRSDDARPPHGRKS